MMSNELSLFEHDFEHPGMRLIRMEFLNWGGYDSEPVTLNFNGESLLLTGVNGVGKTTLMDAASTLFTQRPRFEQANSGEKERSVATYIAGQHKFLKNDEKYGAKTIYALRKDGKNTPISIILAVFADSVGHEFTALQVIRFQGKMFVNGKFGSTERKGIIISRAISISDLVGLRLPSEERPRNYEELMSRIKSIPHTTVFGSLEEYLKDLCKRLNISMKGLKSIANTVSLKFIDDIDEFIRENMLEPTDFSKNLEDLYEIGKKIKETNQKIEDDDKRISILEPLLENEGVAYQSAKSSEDIINKISDGFDDWLSVQKHRLAREELEQVKVNTEKIEKSIEATKKSLVREETRRDEIKISLSQNGGEQLDLYKEKIENYEEKLSNRIIKRDKLSNAVVTLKKQMPYDEPTFNELLIDVENLQEDYKNRCEDYESSIIEYRGEATEIAKQIGVLTEEVRELKKQKGNIPLNLVSTRDRIAQTLNIDKTRLPFVGELLDVSENDLDWEGAINHLLRGFSTIVLVPSDLCHDVSRVVDKMRGIKIKYEEIKDVSSFSKNRISQDSNLVVGKLLINGDVSMTNWLADRLLRKFPHKCCSSISEFNQELCALTKTGLHKENTRYAKDDTKSISDPSNYTIGFSNERKIKAKEDSLRQLDNKHTAITNKRNDADNKLRRIKKALSSIAEILECKRWKDVDTESIKRDIEECRRMMERILQENNYQSLMTDLEKSESNITSLQEKIEELVGEKKVSESKINILLEVIQRPLPSSDIDIVDNFVRKEWTRPLKFDSLDSVAEFVREKIRREKNEIARNILKSQNALETKLCKYTDEFPHDNMRPSHAWLSEFEEKLQKLKTDRIEINKEFNRLCRDDFNVKILGFKSALDVAFGQIRSVIEEKNSYLRTIPFRKESDKPVYIRLKYIESDSADINEFRSNLSKSIYVTDNSGDSAKTSSHRQAAMSILEKIVADSKSDKDSLSRILDVRHWYKYAVSLEFDDGTQQAYYDSSSGDSTGQKKAMASFLFAISRLQTSNKYGYGDDDGSFRFIMMDETNEHCDPETGDSVLQCLKKFHFQTFFVTAEERVAEITPYVGSIYQVIHDTERGEGYTRLVPCVKDETYAE